MKKTRKALLLGVCAVLLVTASVLGTMAYLTATTTPIVNTFTVGKVDIDLKETKTNFKMVPGNTIDKDPKVTVKANSEKCYLFVEVTEGNNVTNYIDYTVDAAWTELKPAAGATGKVYYRVVEANASDQPFSVLTGDKVSVKNSVTNKMMEDAEKEDNQPTLTFKAYACQFDNVTDVTTAWTTVNPTPAP